MNVEDFGGWIEVANSNFQKNFHFIPEALMTIHNNTDSHNTE